MAELWPAVDLGLAPMVPGLRSLHPQSVAPLHLEDQPAVSLQLGTKNVLMQFHFGEPAVFDPSIDLTQSLPKARPVAVGTTDLEPDPGPWRLGNVSFNRTAESFNVGKGSEVRKEDISRQLGKVGGSSQIATSTPITAWAIVGTAVLVILIAMAIGNYESDKDDRKRRKKARRRRHHPSS